MYDSFGFKRNPFNITALRPVPGDALLFVARKAEINSFLVDIDSEDRALALITGHRGVGKSSFASILQFAVSPAASKFLDAKIPASDLIPCYHKVQIEPKESISNLLFKCVSSLLFSIREFQALRGCMFPTSLEPLLNWVSNVVPQSGVTSGINIAGFGGNFGMATQYRSVKDIPASALCEQIRQIISAINEMGCRGIFLNLDNLEIVDDWEMSSLMDQLRDYLFEIKGLWVTMIGYIGIYSSLTRRTSRVSEFVSGQETVLEPLKEEDFIEVLRIRRKGFALTPDQMPPLPLEDEFIRKIYRNTEGEIRAALKACDDVVRAVFKENPTIKSISEAKGLSFLKQIMRQQLGLRLLKPKERAILNEVVKVGSIRPKDYATLTLKSAVDFTNKAKPLLERNLLRKEIEGVAAKYEPSGSVRLALYAGVDLLKD
jgi:energy-coupling factor transporter ATP-binding protein EcfA2